MKKYWRYIYIERVGLKGKAICIESKVNLQDWRDGTAVKSY